MNIRHRVSHQRHFTVVFGVLIAASWIWLLTGHCSAAVPGAVVGAVEGQAEMLTEGKIESVQLSAGSRVEAWNTIATGRSGRLFLRWDDGIVTSSGEMTNVFFSTSLVNGREVPSFQIMGGIVRVAATLPSQRPKPYSVMTPSAHIQPASPDQPADFVVEVYDPSATLVTVLAGNVVVKSLKGGPDAEKIISACQNAFVSQSKEGIEVLDSLPEDLTRIIDNTTIPGTIVADLGACGITSARIQPSPSYGELPPQEYYVQDWDEFDYYPYDEITVLPPRPGVGCVIVLPGLGEFIIPYSVFGTWVYDPVIMQAYARQAFLRRAIHHDRHHLDHWRWKRKELLDAMYFAQLAGNTSMLRQAQRELDDVNVRLNWGERRVRGLEKRYGALDKDREKFGQRLPRGFDVDRVINESLASPNNVKVAQKFQNRVRTDLELQNRLANVAGTEIGELRSNLARERDPRKRQAMLNEFTGLRRSISDGKVPIPQKQTEIKQLVTQLTREKDPNNQENLQRKIISEIQTRQPAGPPEVLDPGKLNTLRQDIGKFPNPERQPELEKRFTEFQRSLESRKGLEEERHRTEEILNQAAKETDPEKQKELLGRWKDLSVPLAVGGIGAAGVMQLRQRQQNLEKQLTDEKDAAKRSTLQQNLEDLRRREADLKVQEERRKTRDAQLQQEQEDQRRRLQPRDREEEPRRQLDQRGRELLDRQRQENEQKAQQLRREQQEQERKQKLLQQQEDRADQAERLKQQQEQLRLQQDKEKQLEPRRRQQEDRAKEEADAKAQEQRRRQEKDQQEQLRQQKRHEEEQQRQEKMRLQQERSKQEQMKLQQEREQQQLHRQEEQQRREQQRHQQERARDEQMKLQREREQQQQMRQQQEQQRQQMKQQQEIQRQQQEQQRQQQMRHQQEQQRHQQAREQQDRERQQQMRQQQEQVQQQQRQQQELQRQQQMRHQQEQQMRHQQEQLRQQQLKEEEERKKRR